MFKDKLARERPPPPPYLLIKCGIVLHVFMPHVCVLGGGGNLEVLYERFSLKNKYCSQGGAERTYLNSGEFEAESFLKHFERGIDNVGGGEVLLDLVNIDLLGQNGLKMLVSLNIIHDDLNAPPLEGCNHKRQYSILCGNNR